MLIEFVNSGLYKKYHCIIDNIYYLNLFYAVIDLLGFQRDKKNPAGQLNTNCRQKLLSKICDYLRLRATFLLEVILSYRQKTHKQLQSYEGLCITGQFIHYCINKKGIKFYKDK